MVARSFLIGNQKQKRNMFYIHTSVKIHVGDELKPNVFNEITQQGTEIKALDPSVLWIIVFPEFSMNSILAGLDLMVTPHLQMMICH